MTNDTRQLGPRRPTGVRNTVYPTGREVLLARLLLRIADTIASKDKDQEFTELYNECKRIAEPALRKAE